MSLFRQFLDVVARHPDAPAIWHKGRAVTYADLAARAAAVARTLDASPRQDANAVVVLLGADPIAEIAGVLGVIAAGAVAVPLDAAQPPARLTRFLQQTAARAMLAADALMPVARGLAPTESVLPIAAGGDDPGRLPEVLPAAPAYVCYTSGSTGEPKGVVFSNGTLADRGKLGARLVGHGPKDRHTLLHSLAVGAGGATLCRTLLSGGALLPRQMKLDGMSGFREWLEDAGATSLFCPPTLFRSLAATLGRNDRLESVRTVRLGGETSTRGDFALFKRHFMPGAIFVNSYSITEGSNLTLHILTHDDEVTGETVPIGRPIPGCRVSVVDEDGREQPAGVTGEIVVESPYLASGYWRAPHLRIGEARPTNEAGASAATRFFTGDLGRLDADGVLTHLGRRDFQTKIRGFRVELEAVESVLSSAPGVAHAAVVVQAMGGEPTLVAYLTAAPGASGYDAARIRAFAEAHLTDGSLPSRFVRLDTLPLTASGKIDRRALAAVTDRDADGGAPDRWADRSPVERQIADVWCGLVGHDAFGPDDDFFVIGGDSLLAMRVVVRIQELFGVAIALQEFLGSPSIAALARRVESRDVNRRLDEIVLTRLLDDLEGR